MKKLLVDIYKVKLPNSGLGQFSLNFHRALQSNSSKEFDLHFLHPSNFDIPQNSEAKYLQASFKNRYLHKVGPDYNLWHSLHQFPAHLPPKNTPQLLTIHDLNFLTEKSSKKSDRYLKKLQKNVDRADFISSISHFTSDIIKKHLNLNGKQVHIIHNGVEFNKIEASKKPTYLHEEKFFLSIGIFNAKKNFHVLLDLLTHFKDHKLVIAGDNNTSYGTKLKEDLKRLKLQDRVILPGMISEREKHYLYSHCLAFLFPSKAEGFGLPIIEAMSAGKPVFCSNSSSLPEIGGDAAYYWDNYDAMEMAKVVANGLDSFNSNKLLNIKRMKDHAAKYNWENCINSYLSLYSKLI